MRTVADGCGCFPTGRHYAGIAHLLRAVVRGLAEEFAGDVDWSEIPVACVDVETTGRDASVDRVVEVGVVVGRHGDVIARYNWLINPGIPIPEEARNVHHISDDDVKDSPRFHEIAHEIAASLAGCIPAAYNAAFDRAFLVNEFGRAGQQPAADAKPCPALRRDVDWIDPLVWAREIHKEEKSKALGEVAQRLGVALENAHRANDDAEAALRVLYRLAADPRVPKAYGAVMQEQRRLALLQSDERRFWKN
ncbi:3'-5' exonuclease [Pendulispora rubella]|uniref:3'-5' exonuclease n=1 Tax=Pendulispora rubella TaxID=2741070 RepID=A0ABZ2L464_9BACT